MLLYYLPYVLICILHNIICLTVEYYNCIIIIIVDNLGLLSSLSVVSRGSTVRHPVITKSMSELGRVTVTTMLGQLSYIMTDFQSEQLDYDRSGYRTRDVKHRSTLTIPLRHRSMKSILSVLNLCYQ